MVELWRCWAEVDKAKKMSKAKVNYVGKTGQTVIEGIECNSPDPFKNGLACVGVGLMKLKFGHVNRRGEYVREPQR